MAYTEDHEVLTLSRRWVSIAAVLIDEDIAIVQIDDDHIKMTFELDARKIHVRFGKPYAKYAWQSPSVLLSIETPDISLLVDLHRKIPVLWSQRFTGPQFRHSFDYADGLHPNAPEGWGCMRKQQALNLFCDHRRCMRFVKVTMLKDHPELLETSSSSSDPYMNFPKLSGFEFQAVELPPTDTSDPTSAETSAFRVIHQSEYTKTNDAAWGPPRSVYSLSVPTGKILLKRNGKIIVACCRD